MAVLQALNRTLLHAIGIEFTPARGPVPHQEQQQARWGVLGWAVCCDFTVQASASGCLAGAERRWPPGAQCSTGDGALVARATAAEVLMKMSIIQLAKGQRSAG